MTIIIGIEDPQLDRAFVFADSGVWRNNSRADTLSQPKIWRDGSWIVGVSGNVGQLQAIRRIRLERPDGESLAALIEELARWATLCLAAVAAQNTNIRQAVPDMSLYPHHILAARGKHVFHVQDQAVIKIERGWTSIGDWEYAEGALSALSDKPPFHQGSRAMLAVDAIVDSVRGPFQWMATDGSGGDFQSPSCAG